MCISHEAGLSQPHVVCANKDYASAFATTHSRGQKGTWKPLGNHDAIVRPHVCDVCVVLALRTDRSFPMFPLPRLQLLHLRNHLL